MVKTIQLGSRLRYPITITKLYKEPNQPIKKKEALFQYSFKWKRTVGDNIRGETWEAEETTYADWSSPSDGELKSWKIRVGQEISRDQDCMVVKESCSHDVQFGGLCAICGKDMTEVNWAAESRDMDRAPINMVHDQTHLTVSETQAQKTENALQRRLLQHRKLSLVVDLDQTIIHACIDPTVGEWQKDPSNPNYPSVRNVKSFQLDDGPRGVANNCWYYIKMRPGLEDFLKKISTMYELHVYTMGTRAYAQNVARIVDPDKKLFGNRVISRDENGNMYAKSLQRLFPVSTKMVVIIDDRADVWPRNRPNLIKVSPYDFFKGIGDINSGFLPKQQGLLTPSAAATTNGGLARIAPAPSPDKEDSTTMEPPLEKALEEQEKTLEKQIKDRPLQALQEQQDKQDEAAERASATPENGNTESTTPPPPHHRHQVLQDDDRELAFLENHLTALHKFFFQAYEQNRLSQPSSSPSSLDTQSIPDVGSILTTLKAQALSGCKIVLSGIVPIGMDVYRSEIGLQVASFGAELRSSVTRDVTHLVVSSQRPRTKKVRQAIRYLPKIKIVNQDWLAACFSEWRVVEEGPYSIEGLEDAQKKLNEKIQDAEATETVSDADDTDSGNAPPGKKRILRLKSPPRVRFATAASTGNGEDEDEDEEDSDSGGDDEGEDEDMDEELEAFKPTDADGQLSPIDGLKTFNWGSADEELAEFLESGSDDDEEEEEEEEEDEDDDEDGDNVNCEDDEEAPAQATTNITTTSSSYEQLLAAQGTAPSTKRKADDEEEEESHKRRKSLLGPGPSSLRNELKDEDVEAPTAEMEAQAAQDNQDAHDADDLDKEFEELDEEALEADFLAMDDGDGDEAQGQPVDGDGTGNGGVDENG
ncbi:RNA polymerase [Neurospora intermedia]|uniref:RNA polymerase II subunit A C-terminal domain phosphatase n=1 Tax=Neurospora intermedia TaxID=5142 RepID=A0ABR3CXJ0_NEUIN